MASQYSVCVVGPAGLVGETLLEILDARAFPVGDLFLVDDAERAGDCIAFGGEDYTVRDLEDFDFSQCQLVFFCVDRALAEVYAPLAAEAGALVIDDSDAFRDDLDVPLVVPEVNSADLDGYEARRIVANPNSCAIIIALALHSINEAVGLSQVNAVTIQSVSGAGRAAVDELAQQAIGLFNHKPAVCEVFPKQIAFNLLPQIGGLDAMGHSREETKIKRELPRLLRKSDIEINVTAVRAPVFYGHAVALHLVTERALSREQARGILDSAPGIVLYEDDEDPAGYPTPMVEAASNDPVFVGRVRESGCENGLNLWVVADNMRKGGALNMVQIAEDLLEKYLA